MRLPSLKSSPMPHKRTLSQNSDKARETTGARNGSDVQNLQGNKRGITLREANGPMAASNRGKEVT